MWFIISESLLHNIWCGELVLGFPMMKKLVRGWYSLPTILVFQMRNFIQNQKAVHTWMLPKVMRIVGTSITTGDRTYFIPITLCISGYVIDWLHIHAVLSPHQIMLCHRRHQLVWAYSTSAPRQQPHQLPLVSALTLPGCCRLTQQTLQVKIMIRVTLITPPPNLCFSSD